MTEKTSGEKPAGEKPAGEKPAGEKPAGEKPAGEKPAASGSTGGAKPRSRKKEVRLNLALQGGGSHGAFTWGVLDALLEDEGCEFEGISGTSAGAMNAAVLAAGFAQASDLGIKDAAEELAKGRELARANLRKFWESIGTMGSFLTVTPARLAAAWAPWLKPMLSSPFSPAQANPMDINPLRGVLRQTVDFDLLRKCFGRRHVPRLFICATNVRSGRSRIFEGEDVCIDALMASACLPQMFNSVEIDGEHYWDGGYSGNPAIYPLIYRCACDDVLLVQINPIEAPNMPVTLSEIQERINEVTFNNSLLSEMRTINFVSRLITEGRLDKDVYKALRMHRIDGGAALREFGSDSKNRADISFIHRLHNLGRDSANKWLRKHRRDIGVRASMPE